jgi:hypothetical protein
MFLGFYSKFSQYTPAFEEYCNMWKLTVNTNKTKNVVFSKKKYKTNIVFKIYGQAIDLQD